MELEIEAGTAISAAVIILLIALPFLMLNNSRRKREKKFRQSLTSIAIRNNCQINQHEIVGNYAIGIDETRNILFFYQQAKDKEVEQSVDLQAFQGCKVIKSSRTIKNNSGNQEVVDMLELSFAPIGGGRPETKLEFFNTNVSVQLTGELQSIEKWSKLINDRAIRKLQRA